MSNKKMHSGVIGLLLIVLWLSCGGWAAAAKPSTRSRQQHPHHKVLHQAGWAGAGIAAGQVAGPAGSAAVGATKYRRDLKAGGPRRTRAVAKISAPIAAGAVAGPAGTVGYEAVEHRHWIKRHILHQKPAPRRTLRPKPRS